MKPLLLIGAGGHARSLIDLIETQGEWHIHGLIGLPEQVGSTVLSYPVLGTDDDLPTLRSTCPAALLGLGQLPDPALRQRLASQLKHLDFLCPVVVDPGFSDYNSGHPITRLPALITVPAGSCKPSRSIAPLPMKQPVPSCTPPFTREPVLRWQ